MPTIQKKMFLVGIRMLYLSLKELKLIAKNKDIKGYKNMSKDGLLSKFNTPKKKNFLNKKEKKIKKVFMIH